jgi:Flp pilus assembly protein TadD/ketosteroid isomerase-like protein
MNIFDNSSGKKQMKAHFTELAVLLALSVGSVHCAFAGAVANAAPSQEMREINLLTEQGNQAAALEKVNAYIVNNPKDAEALFMKGVILVEQGKRDEAIKAFNDLTEKYPNLPEPYNNLAVLYADQGQYDKARKALETAIKTHPSYATAHENLGDIYARLASEAYDKAFKLDTSNARAQSKLSMITDLFGGTKSAAAAKTAGAKVVANKDATSSNALVPTPTAASKPTEIKKPEPVKSAVAQSGNQESAVIDALNAWAKAWSAQDVSQYLASYAETFKPANGQSRKAWEQARKERVSRPKHIEVAVDNPKVTVESDTQAKVSFRQTYTAAGKPQSTNKTLYMAKSSGRWLITEEVVGR